MSNSMFLYSYVFDGWNDESPILFSIGFTQTFIVISSIAIVSTIALILQIIYRKKIDNFYEKINELPKIISKITRGVLGILQALIAIGVLMAIGVIFWGFPIFVILLLFFILGGLFAISQNRDE